MKIFLNNNIFQVLISNLRRVTFLDIAIINMLILFAFVGILVIIPSISSYKIRKHIVNLAKFLHLLSILCIAISLFMAKVLNYKLSESLRFFFGLNFAVVLTLAISILVSAAEFLGSIFHHSKSYYINEYKNTLIVTFLTTYISYVFIFIILGKSVSVLILGSIIILCVNIFCQKWLDNMKIYYSRMDKNLEKCALEKDEFYSNFNLLIDAIKSIIKDNPCNISMQSNDKDYNSHETLPNEGQKSFSLDEKSINEKLKNGFLDSKAILIKLINKELELCEFLKNQKLSRMQNEKVIKWLNNGREDLFENYNGKMKDVMTKLKNSLTSLEQLGINSSYFQMNLIVFEHLNIFLPKVAEINKAFDNAISVALKSSKN